MSAIDSAPARRGRGRPRDPKTDQRIIEAATQLMLERGFDKSTVDEVATRAGVGKATVYRRWSSKEDLAVSAMEALFNTEFPEPDTGSLVGDLTESYAGLLAFAHSPQGAEFMRMGVAEAIRDPRIAALYRDSVERREKSARQRFQRAIDNGELRPDANIDAAMHWLGGMLTVWVVIGRPLPPMEEVESLVKFALQGVMADPPAGQSVN